MPTYADLSKEFVNNFNGVLGFTRIRFETKQLSNEFIVQDESYLTKICSRFVPVNLIMGPFRDTQNG